MLIERERTGKGQSKFICDRCEIDLTSKTRNSIYTREGKETPKKRWDLCRSLFCSIKKRDRKGSVIFFTLFITFCS